jgi:hypothetical protein
MSDKTDKAVELKSRAYAEKHDLDSKIQIDGKGLYAELRDLHESTVLLDAGVTVEQYKKIQQGDAQLLSAVTLVAGEKFAAAAKSNNELVEASVSYPMGSNTVATVMFNRDSKDHVVAAVETRVKSAEHKRVIAHLDSLFDDVNS